MAFSAKKRESVVSLQCHSKDIKLTFTARYGNDREEEMEVDNESESTISLQYHYKDLALKFAARYGIDGKERMEVDDEPVVQLPHEVQLNVSDTQECRFQYDYSSIQDDVIGNMGFLENFVDSPPVVMKTVRCITVYLWEKDAHGIHLVPENEHLTITKVDEHGRTSAFIYRSNPAKDTITVSEYQQINNFVGVHPKKKWLTSVLWLLSELAVNQFGKGR